MDQSEAFGNSEIISEIDLLYDEAKWFINILTYVQLWSCNLPLISGGEIIF